MPDAFHARAEEGEVERGLSALEAHPAVTRELLMRRMAERWLEGERKAEDADARGVTLELLIARPENPELRRGTQA